MKKNTIAAVSVAALSALALSSCDSPTGQGAAVGAGAGALIGAAATGNVRGALIGAASGAAAGALIGHAVQESQAGPPPRGGFPWAHRTGRPGLVVSPYPPNNYVDVRGIPHGALVRDPSTGGYFRRP
ncbi:MAG: glycine zipper domain-containing protein [Verrucomicrobiota bacterium]|nr:glycine zipper domain-containing protein [Verrucomicrobiota bacterium]